MKKAKYDCFHYAETIKGAGLEIFCFLGNIDKMKLACT